MLQGIKRQMTRRKFNLMTLKIASHFSNYTIILVIKLFEIKPKCIYYAVISFCSCYLLDLCVKLDNTESNRVKQKMNKYIYGKCFLLSLKCRAHFLFIHFLSLLFVLLGQLISQHCNCNTLFANEILNSDTLSNGSFFCLFHALHKIEWMHVYIF